jgi:surface carbohydrate biosynthesis protein
VLGHVGVPLEALKSGGLLDETCPATVPTRQEPHVPSKYMLNSIRSVLPLEGGKRRWVYLPVEVKARELQSRILLGCFAAEAGFGVVVGKKYPLNELASDLPRGLYVDKSCQLGALPELRYRRAAGHIITCLDEEGVVYEDAEAYAASRLSAQTLHAVHRFYAWGHDQAGVIDRFFPDCTSRVSVTGNPRVDLWRPEFRAVFGAEADALQSQYGHYVLVASSFGRAFRGPDAFLPANRLRAARLGVDPDELAAQNYDYSLDLLSQLSEAVVELARTVPDRIVVVRPHQADDPSHWEKVATRQSNILVIREGPITPWLMGADAVVHNNSTSGIESFLIGRPTIVFAPRSDERFDMNVPNALGTVARSSAALIDLVRFGTEAAAVTPDKRSNDILRRHFASLDGPLASEHLVAAFAAIDVPEVPPSRSILERAGSRVRTAPLSAAFHGRRLAHQLHLRRDSEAPPPPGYHARFAGSEEDEVTGFLDSLARSTRRFRDVRCARLAPDVYLLSAG